MKKRRAVLSEYFQGGRKKFRRMADQVHREMDPEDLHQLRVLTRRLRAVVWLSRHSRKGPGLRRLRNDLRDLGHALGERRSLDVMMASARHYKLDSESLRRQARSAGEKVRRLLAPKKVRSLVKEMKDGETRLVKLTASDLEPATAELLARLEDLRRARSHNRQAWHRVRIEAKKIRYAAEILGVKMPELEKIQDQLGKGHDLVILGESLGRNARLISDEKKTWKRAGRQVPEALRKTERRLFQLRSESAS